MTKNNDLKAAFEAEFKGKLLLDIRGGRGRFYFDHVTEKAWEAFQAGAKFERERMIKEIASVGLLDIVARAIVQSRIVESRKEPKATTWRNHAKAAQTAIVKIMKGE